MIPGLLRSTNCMDVLQPPLILFHGREAALECAERRPSYADLMSESEADLVALEHQHCGQ